MYWHWKWWREPWNNDNSVIQDPQSYLSFKLFVLSLTSFLIGQQFDLFSTKECFHASFILFQASTTNMLRIKIVIKIFSSFELFFEVIRSVKSILLWNFSMYFKEAVRKGSCFITQIQLWYVGRGFFRFIEKLLSYTIYKH